MPIVAYMGVPNDKSTDQNFKDFRDCGFNVSLYGYASLKQLINACDVAQKYGIRILGHCPETHGKPEHAALQLKSNKGFFGYVLQDEPSAPEILSLNREIKRLMSVDNTHCFYINLHPYYEDWIIEHTKTKSYNEYVDIAAKAFTQQISFDFYPVTTEGLRDNWYNNLEIIRNKSIEVNKPFWGFVLSTPHNNYPQPTMATLRLQVYSNLAYGAQAIQYFTYWTPPTDRDNNYYNGPISLQGKKTSTYYLVQRMNRELSNIAPLFFGAEVQNVTHLVDVPKGCHKMTILPENIHKIKVTGKKGAIFSEFKMNDHKYLAVVNKDYKNKMKLHIETKNNVPVKINTDLSQQEIFTDYIVPQGAMLIFRIK